MARLAFGACALVVTTILSGCPGAEDPAPPCPPGQITCGGQCVDPGSDRRYCGASGACTGASAGVACPSGEVCSAGACVLSCPAGQLSCAGRCVDPNTDRAFCGASADCAGASAGAVCADGWVCSAGTCRLTCQEGLVDCGGRCIDPSSDRDHCGAGGACIGSTAGVSCGPGQVCAAGACTTSCPAGQIVCAGRCVDPLTDRAFCGASAACEGAAAGALCAAGEVCSGGACVVSCQAGLLDCGGRCVDPLADPLHCGASGTCQGPDAGVVCAPGQACASGTCVTSCPAGQIACSRRCVDPNSDPMFCGASADCSGASAGAACGAGQVCSSGTCAESCQPGLVLCGGRCIDPEADPRHCGAFGPCLGTSAGSACAAGHVCSTGACVISCPTGQVACAGRCVDPATDRAFCGARGTCTGGEAGAVCGAGQVCEAGACQTSCPTGQIACGGQCVDPQRDARYCGGSGSCSGPQAGTACGFGQVCVSGACASACPSPMVACPGVGCVNVLVDAAHCGGCNQTCSGGAVCSSGTCTVATCSGTVSLSGLPVSELAWAPGGVALADMNGDGALDAVGVSDLGIQVFLNLGDGTFAAPLSNGGVSAEPILADLNADGAVDVLTETQIFLNAGDGTLSLPSTYAANGPVVLGDVEGDGRADVINLGQQVSWWPVLPGGTLGTRVFTSFSNPAYALPRGGDLTGDGRTDLALYDWTRNAVVVVSSDGADFVAPVYLPIDHRVSDIQLADLDADGRLDVVAATGDGNTVSVFLNSASGLGGRVDYPVPYPTRISIGDLDGDGRADVATASIVSGYVFVLLNAGDGSLLPAQEYASGHPLGGSYDLALGDVDADGKPDAVVVASGYPMLRTLSGDGGGGFVTPGAYQADLNVGTIRAADVDANGTIDLVATGDSGLQVLLGDGSGALSSSISNVGGGPLAVADLDGDGRPDLATGSLLLLQNGGGGAFASWKAFPVPATTLDAGDVDGDGRPDLLASGSSWGPGTITFLRNQGQGDFSVMALHTALGNAFLADANGDGALDVVATNAGAVDVLLGDGLGAFAAPVSYDIGLHAGAAAIDDLNEDGRPDLVATVSAALTAPPTALVVRLGRLDGTFGPASAFPIGTRGGNGVVNVVTSDLDGDARRDVVVFAGWFVRVLFGRGDGTFEPEQVFYPGAANLWSGTVVDLQLDGRPDVVAGSIGGGLQVLTNTCRP